MRKFLLFMFVLVIVSGCSEGVTDPAGSEVDMEKNTSLSIVIEGAKQSKGSIVVEEVPVIEAIITVTSSVGYENSKTWIKDSNDNSFMFPNLSSGSYHIEIKEKDQNGHENTFSKDLEVVVGNNYEITVALGGNFYVNIVTPEIYTKITGLVTIGVDGAVFIERSYLKVFAFNTGLSPKTNLIFNTNFIPKLSFSLPPISVGGLVAEVANYVGRVIEVEGTIVGGQTVTNICVTSIIDNGDREHEGYLTAGGDKNGPYLCLTNQSVISTDYPFRAATSLSNSLADYIGKRVKLTGYRSVDSFGFGTSLRTRELVFVESVQELQ